HAQRQGPVADTFATPSGEHGGASAPPQRQLQKGRPVHTRTARRLLAGVGATAVLVATLAGPALASDTVILAITGSGLTASVADLTLTSVPYQNAAHNVTGTMTLTADDSTGSGAGWTVTIMSSALVWVGTANGGLDIPANQFSLSSAAAPVKVAGQVVSVAASTGPQVPPTSPLGSLDTPRKTL